MSGGTKKIVIVVVLLVLFAGVLVWQLMPDKKYRQYMANQNKNPQTTSPHPQPAGQRPATAAPAAQATAAARPAASPAQGSVFTSSNVDLDTLLARVQEVEFDYESERLPRNPMRPLVGPMAPTKLSQGQEADQDSVTSFEAERIASNMKVTGILFDEHNPMAVINGEVVSPGHHFPEGVVVDQIEEGRVTLRVQDALIPIELEER